MSKTGDQVPVIPFVEVAGNGFAAPAQIGAIALKVGTVLGGFTLTVSVVVFVAHCPAFGEKV